VLFRVLEGSTIVVLMRFGSLQVEAKFDRKSSYRFDGVRWS
jgi:hypothetical protein